VRRHPLEVAHLLLLSDTRRRPLEPPPHSE
jgi:hypothetical protein